MVKMGKVYRSMKEIERKYLPMSYIRTLLKQKRFGELVKYIIKKDIEFDYELTKEMNPKDIGSLLAEISLFRIKRVLQN